MDAIIALVRRRDALLAELREIEATLAEIDRAARAGGALSAANPLPLSVAARGTGARPDSIPGRTQRFLDDHPERVWGPSEIAAGINVENHRLVRAALARLLGEGRIARPETGKYRSLAARPSESQPERPPEPTVRSRQEEANQFD